MAHLFAKWHRPKGGHPAVAAKGLSTDFRLFALAVDWMNSRGHAHFNQGDIYAALPDVSERSIRRTIKSLKDAGLFAPDSTVRLLVVSADVASHALVKTGRKCPHGCHEKVYYDAEWYDPQDWQRSSTEDAKWASAVRERIEEAA